MKKSFLIILILFISFSGSFSQKSFLNIYPDSTAVFKLEDIVITANKTPTPYVQVGSSITIISQDEILASNKTNVLDLLRSVPGLSISQQGGESKLAAVYLRGANSDQTLVLIDGVKVNDPGSPKNAFDFSSLQTNNIDRIEILRGPQSTLYGSDALAGVISIFTKQGEGNPDLTISAETGSYNTYHGMIASKGALGNLNYSVNLSRKSSDGFSAISEIYGNTEKDEYSINSISSILGYSFNENISMQLFYRFRESETGLDQFDKNGDDPNYFFKEKNSLFRTSFNLSMYEGKWTQQFGISYYKNFTTSSDLTDEIRTSTASNSINNGTRIKADWQNLLKFIEGHDITIGIETEEEKAGSEYYSESEWGPFNSIFPEQSIRTTGAYIQDQMNFYNKLFVSAGIRYDNNEKFGDAVTYRIVPAYFISAINTKLKASFGNAFKSPSLFYLFDPSFGNPELEPEKSTGYDFGLEYFSPDGKLNASVTYFQNTYTNLFNFDQNFKAINIDKAETKGAEFLVELRPINLIFLSFNYTYTDAKDLSENSSEYNLKLLRRPEHKAGLAMRFNPEKSFNIMGEVQYVGSREDKDFSTFPASRITLSDYLILNLGVNFNFLNNFTLYGKAENLLDRKYEEVLYYGTPGRAFYFGIKFELK